MHGEILSIQINDYIARYRLFVEQENRANRYNINIRAESFFIPIIKNIFTCPNLENLNIKDKNFPGLDLGDREKRIAFQITSDVSSSKVVSCLEKFASDKYGLYRDFDKLIIFMLQNRQVNYTNKKISEFITIITDKNKRFSFTTSEDIVDLRFISTKINTIEDPIKSQIHEAFMLELDGDFLSPLSKKPETPRPIIEIPIVKREKEYLQLKESKEDILIIGQPGIGKTFLLYKFAQENNNTYFVNNESKYNLSRAISILKPDILIVDDAHKCPEIINILRFIRENSDHKFKIIASCWPTEKREIINHYGKFTPKEGIELEKLSKDDLAELLILLLNKFGLERKLDLEQNIIDQSIGSPGILVGLFLLCKDTKGEDVLNGKALISHLTNIALETRSEIEWKKTKRLLAYFSVGGTSGMTYDEISNAINLSIFEIETILSTFNYGGIFINFGDRIIIRPPLLQAALIKEEFFDPINPRKIESLSSIINQKNECLSVILYAAGIGAEIPDSWLVELLVKINSDTLWEKYYLFCPKKITQRLNQYPDTLNACVYPGLLSEPEFVLPLILRKASLDEKKGDRHPEDNLKKIQDWINSDVNSEQTILKRKQLLVAIVNDLNAIEDTIKIKILSIIISPRFENNHMEPGSGNKVVFQFGIFSIDIIEKIFLFWQDVFQILKSIDSRKHTALLSPILDWAYPSRAISTVDEKTTQFMNKKAVEILFDMVKISQNHPALLMEYKDILSNLSTPIDIEIDPLYKTLFPERSKYIEDQNNPIYMEEVKNHSVILAQRPIDDFCEKIKWLLQEAKIANDPWPCFVPNLCYELALIVDNPILYAEKLIQIELPAEIIAPFFEIAVSKNHPGWHTFANTLILSPKYYLIICNTVFALEEPPDDLLSACINKLDDLNSGWVKFFCWHHNVPMIVIKQLLNHKNKKIASAAAIGEWYSEPKGRVREEIINHWENAIISSTEDDLFIKDILITNPTLAFRWLMNYFTVDHLFISREMVNPIAASIQVLDNNQRKDLIIKLDNSENKLENKEKIITWIIGDDLELFEYFLNLPNSDNQNIWRIAPLQTLPNGNSWCTKVLMALANGVTEENIIDASFLGLFENAYTGSTSNQYKRIAEAYAQLLNHENEKIKKIANMGYAISQDRMSVHLREEERREDLY